MPKHCLNIENQPKFTMLPIELLDNTVNLSELESQWQKLPTVNQELKFGEKPSSSAKFWCNVYNYENNVGQFVFRELSIFAMKIMVFPLSNALVERIFSIMKL